MNKKEFYEAPEWGMRVVMVQRHYLLNDSLGSAGNGYDGDGNDLGDLVDPE